MTPSGTFLLEKVAGPADQPAPFADTAPCSMEQALLRARIAFDAGWQLTPDEILAAYNGNPSHTPQASFVQTMSVDSEDEIDELPAFFSENE